MHKRHTFDLDRKIIAFRLSHQTREQAQPSKLKELSLCMREEADKRWQSVKRPLFDVDRRRAGEKTKKSLQCSSVIGTHLSLRITVKSEKKKESHDRVLQECGIVGKLSSTIWKAPKIHISFWEIWLQSSSVKAFQQIHWCEKPSSTKDDMFFVKTLFPKRMREEINVKEWKASVSDLEKNT